MGTEDLPDLSQHHTVLAKVLREDAGLYARFRLRRSGLGTCLAECIQPGLEHPTTAGFAEVVGSTGLVAGDEDCYEVFRDLFARVTEESCPGASLSQQHRSDMNVDRLSPKRALPTPDSPAWDRRLLSSRVCFSRNFSGWRFPPAMSLEERQEVESAVVKALSDVEGTPMQGDYYPASGSTTWPACSSTEAGCHLEKLSSALAVSSGLTRDWPHGRGVFVTRSRRVSATLNQEDHLTVTASRCGGESELREAFLEASSFLTLLSQSLRKGGGRMCRFAADEHFGYLTSCPARCGTALSVTVTMRLPLLARQDSFPAWCRANRSLEVRVGAAEPGASEADIVEVSRRGRQGLSEVATFDSFVEALHGLQEMERLLSLHFASQAGSGEAQPSLDELAGLVPQGTCQAEVRGAESCRSSSPVESCTDEAEDAWRDTGAALRMMVGRAIDGVVAPVDAESSSLRGFSEACPSGAFGVTMNAQEVAAATVQATDADMIAFLMNLQPAAFQKLAEVTAGYASASSSAAAPPAACPLPERPLSPPPPEHSDSPLPPANTPPQLSEAPAPVSGDHLDEMREKVRIALEESVDTGTLVSVLQSFDISQSNGASQPQAEARPAEVVVDVSSEDISQLRESLRLALEVSCESGVFDRVLNGEPACIQEATAPAAKPDVNAKLSDENLESLREAMRGVLEASAEDGSLHDHIRAASMERPGEVQHAASAAPASGTGGAEDGRPRPSEDAEVEVARIRLLEALEESVERGQLEAVLQKMVGARPTEAEDAISEDLRGKLRSLLEESLDNGLLEKVLADTTGTQVEDGDTVVAQPSESQVREVLEDALASGSLEAVLQQQMQANAPQEASAADDVVGLREHLKSTLEESMQSGLLEQALQKAFECQGQDLVDVAAQGQSLDLTQRPDLQETRLALRELLQDAADSGQLHEALAFAHGAQAAATTEVVQAEAAETVPEGYYPSDAQAVPGTDAEAEASVDVDAVRLRMRDLFEDCLDQGSLADKLLRSKTAPFEEADAAAAPQEVVEETADTTTAATAPAETANVVDQDLLDIKQKVGTRLLEGLENGSLEEYIMSNGTALYGAGSMQTEGAAEMTVDAPVVCKRDLNSEFAAAVHHAKDPDADQAAGPLALISATGGCPQGEDTDAVVPLVDFLQNSRTLVAAAPARAPHPVLEVLGNSERRIGALMAMVHAVKQQIAAADCQAAEMEATLRNTREESASLLETFQATQRRLEEQEARGLELEGIQRKLETDIDVQAQQTRHANLERESLVFSARSDISTACSLREGGATWTPSKSEAFAVLRSPGAPRKSG
eukprot:TRINITY_DN90180_c0_g1_i1.p1 TRINITY_DN90180_c0_g1~~TRINITY_DN90180_c0_g1_i1.p1  ORF type:complete len:1318 (+),score=354.44 TRINITY_DN90180_c0_g1_i1:140-4093(+)